MFQFGSWNAQACLSNSFTIICWVIGLCVVACRAPSVCIFLFNWRLVVFLAAEQDDGVLGARGWADAAWVDTCEIWCCFHPGVFSRTGCEAPKNIFLSYARSPWETITKIVCMSISQRRIQRFVQNLNRFENVPSMISYVVGPLAFIVLSWCVAATSSNTIRFIQICVAFWYQ